MRVVSWRLLAALMAVVVAAGSCTTDGSAQPDVDDTTPSVTDDTSATSATDPESPSSSTTTTTTGSTTTSPTTTSSTTATTPATTTTTTTTTATTPSSTTTTSAPGPCDTATISRDFGAVATLVDNACQDGWALVDRCGDSSSEPCADGWVVARFEAGVWSVITGFPTTLCRSDLVERGAPDAVLAPVNWPPQCISSATTPPSTTQPPATQPPATLSEDEVLARFAEAWTATDWTGMAAVADPAAIAVAQEWSVVGGEAVLPAFDSCRAMVPGEHWCEILYDPNRDAFGFLFSLKIAAGRVFEMAFAGTAG